MKSFAALALPLLLVNQVLCLGPGVQCVGDNCHNPSICRGYNWGLSLDKTPTGTPMVVRWDDGCVVQEFINQDPNSKDCMQSPSFKNCNVDKEGILKSFTWNQYTCWTTDIPDARTCPHGSTNYGGHHYSFPDVTMFACCSDNPKLRGWSVQVEGNNRLTRYQTFRIQSFAPLVFRYVTQCTKWSTRSVVLLRFEACKYNDLVIHSSKGKLFSKALRETWIELEGGIILDHSSIKVTFFLPLLYVYGVVFRYGTKNFFLKKDNLPISTT